MPIPSNYSTLNSVVTNALLHLYLTLSYSVSHVSKKERKRLLIGFIKPKIKDKNYRHIKKELLLLVGLDKKPNVDLEQYLYQCHSSIEQEKSIVNAADKLFELLELIRKDLQLEIVFVDNAVNETDEAVFIIKDHVEHCFTGDGDQVAPVTLMLKTKSSVNLHDYINDTGLFKCEMTQSNQSVGAYAFLLHPA